MHHDLLFFAIASKNGITWFNGKEFKILRCMQFCSFISVSIYSILVELNIFKLHLFWLGDHLHFYSILIRYQYTWAPLSTNVYSILTTGNQLENVVRGWCYCLWKRLHFILFWYTISIILSSYLLPPTFYWRLTIDNHFETAVRRWCYSLGEHLLFATILIRYFVLVSSYLPKSTPYWWQAITLKMQCEDEIIVLENVCIFILFW